MGFCVCWFSLSLSPSLTAEYMMLAIKRRAALYTFRVAFRDQGAMSSSVLSWTHHSAEGWHLLSHSHTLTIILANNQVLDPSQILKSSVCACEQCFNMAATKRERAREGEILAVTLLNLFLTGAELIHPHKHHISAPRLIYWFILYGVRRAPSIHSTYHKVTLNLQVLSFLGCWFKLCLMLFFFISPSFLKGIHEASTAVMGSNGRPGQPHPSHGRIIQSILQAASSFYGFIYYHTVIVNCLLFTSAGFSKLVLSNVTGGRALSIWQDDI